jgi:two-component system chemotaxis response regulator CheB
VEQSRIDPPYKVLIVDDSAIVRGLVTRMLQEDPDIEVVGSVVNGEDALAVMRKGGVEAVVLDIEMPVMDGLTALPKILEIDPTVRVIMASTLTKRNADISFQAMTLGAVDYVPKPSSAKDLNVGAGFRAELLDKVKAWSEQRRKMLESQVVAVFDEDEDDDTVSPAEDISHDRDVEAENAKAADVAGADDHDDHREKESGRFRAELSAEHQVLHKPGRIQRKRFTAELRPRPMQQPGRHAPQRPMMAHPAAAPAHATVQAQAERTPQAEIARDPGRLIRDAAVAASHSPAGSKIAGADVSTASRPSSAPVAKRTGTEKSAPVAKAPAVADRRVPDAPARRARVQGGAVAPAPKRSLRAAGGKISLVPEKHISVDAIAIGSSTGGPQALFEVLRGLVGVKQPIFITQHMPATFTTILAEHITRLTGMKCQEGVNGEPVQPGRVYLAPGDYHMVVEGRGNSRHIALNQNPPENFCRPSVDPMLRSLVGCYGGNILTIILTGMGQDGMLGGRDVVSAGGMVVAQDEATSVVWGMPGAVAQAGVCTAVLPVGGIAGYVKKFAGGR